MCALKKSCYGVIIFQFCNSYGVSAQIIRPQGSVLQSMQFSVSLHRISNSLRLRLSMFIDVVSSEYRLNRNQVDVLALQLVISIRRFVSDLRYVTTYQTICVQEQSTIKHLHGNPKLYQMVIMRCNVVNNTSVKITGLW